MSFFFEVNVKAHIQQLVDEMQESLVLIRRFL